MDELQEKIERLLARLPGKDCGLCGERTCRALAEEAITNPQALRKCIYLDTGSAAAASVKKQRGEGGWKDLLGREYDFILEKFPDDPGPRELIFPFNPVRIEKLGIRKGDILYGRPAMLGCPVTHAGVVMAAPDLLNGTIEWCVIGPQAARQRGIELGMYTPIAYEGIVSQSRVELCIGGRYLFLPRYCMLQSRHSGVISFLARRDGVLTIRVEGIWIA